MRNKRANVRLYNWKTTSTTEENQPAHKRNAQQTRERSFVYHGNYRLLPLPVGFHYVQTEEQVQQAMMEEERDRRKATPMSKTEMTYMVAAFDRQDYDCRLAHYTRPNTRKNAILEKVIEGLQRRYGITRSKDQLRKRWSDLKLREKEQLTAIRKIIKKKDKRRVLKTAQLKMRSQASKKMIPEANNNIAVDDEDTIKETAVVDLSDIELDAEENPCENVPVCPANEQMLSVPPNSPVYPVTSTGMYLYFYLYINLVHIYKFALKIVFYVVLPTEEHADLLYGPTQQQTVPATEQLFLDAAADNKVGEENVQDILDRIETCKAAITNLKQGLGAILEMVEAIQSKVAALKK
ncbi:uncharacterized protein LOC121403062 isoform X1 [Xenopus laevis]|uniref:Uncharacterized protein LOC121394639 isoform X1 n=1 Tax=Xenopus laevis TaxID=8355 RepID=A0A8J1L0L0_XENLA|nr:uncharacterized protein LOC121394639 isoform X1 [Xenopus laevis]XP_041446439.1 uncharacterized protein LOC121403062 isoform X1 [Xenopus laevis]